MHSLHEETQESSEPNGTVVQDTGPQAEQVFWKVSSLS